MVNLFSSASLILANCPYPFRCFITKKDVGSYGDIMNQVIWNNKNILREWKSIYLPVFHKCGIIKVGDLISNDRAFLKSEKVVQAQ